MATIEETYFTDIAHKKDFLLSAQGGFQTISGRENVINALFRRIITVPGSLIHRPDYGAGLKTYQNVVNSIDNQLKLAEDIRVQISQDSRVEEVNEVSIIKDNQDPAKFTIKLRVRLVGVGEITAERVFDGS